MSTHSHAHTPQANEVASSFDAFVARFTAARGRVPTVRDAFEAGVGANARALLASADSIDAHRQQSLEVVKDALLRGVRAYLRRAASGGMPAKEVAAVEAVVRGVIELEYLDAALQARATEVASLLAQCAFDDAYHALRSCRVIETDGTVDMQFDESLVQCALYGLAAIRARARLASAASQTHCDGA